MSTLTGPLPKSPTLEKSAEPAVKLRAWNSAEAGEAVESILPCNGSRAWAEGMVGRKPFGSVEALSAAADDVWNNLSAADRQQAFDSHPRIGETRARVATEQSLHWSHGEQSAAAPDEAARRALALGNKAYEERFGRIFLVCATGKSAAEMLAIQGQRMRNDPEMELQIAGEEQRKITQIRLKKWLGLEQDLTAGSAEEIG